MDDAMADELAALDATATAQLVRSGELSAAEVVDAAIARIEKLDPKLNAVIIPLFEQAREVAAGELPDGPFRGVPFLLKDLDVTFRGRPFHGGMRVLKEAGYVAKQTSHVVEKFLAAGLVVLGKTNTPELGLAVTTEPQSYGPSCNPWSPDYSTGGSSGGSAAAVASGMVPVAHAADGGGSIRIPASECGLVGLKPSRGRVSLGPEYGEYWAGFVISHVVSRSLRDSAGLLDSVAGPMPGDPYCAAPPLRPYADEIGADPGRLRVGLMPVTPEGAPECHPECSAAVESAGHLLESLGHAVELAHPPALDEYALVQSGFGALVACWTAKGLAYWSREFGRELQESDVESATWLLAKMGQEVTAQSYLEGLEGLHAWSRRVATWWLGGPAHGFDLLVTPTIAIPPPRLGEISATPEDPTAGMQKLMEITPYTIPFNITGQPAISLPLAYSRAGLPIGVQLIAAANREDLLFRVASQLESAQPWEQSRPALFG
jgi:amidase